MTGALGSSPSRAMSGDTLNLGDFYAGKITTESATKEERICVALLIPKQRVYVPIDIPRFEPAHVFFDGDGEGGRQRP